MPSKEYDLGYLSAAIPVLKDYLLSDEIYWSIGVNSPAGEPPYPQLTLGGILLAQKRLQARQKSGEKISGLASLEMDLEVIISKWKVAWDRKTSREFRARLNLWADFLEEYRANPENNYDRYAYEITRRVMLQLLEPQASKVEDEELKMLAGLDSLLKAVFVSGDFIWDGVLAAGFPAREYWYLYGRLRH